MDADSLWNTTMNPATRKVFQLTTDNFTETLELFETLMGNSSAARRNFIIQNSKLLVEENDFFGEEEI